MDVGNILFSPHSNRERVFFKTIQYNKLYGLASNNYELRKKL